jgi:hypothetical protein
MKAIEPQMDAAIVANDNIVDGPDWYTLRPDAR